MKSSPPLTNPSPSAAPGRPREVEEATNRYLVHPVSRALVDRLIFTRITPNQVSIASVFAAASGAVCYLELSWPWGATCGLACQYVWHVLDGADGDLARRTGRASPIGELVDGVCDHVSQLLVYGAFVALLYPALHAAAWGLAVLAGVSHFVQANAYESGRKTYRRWVYGAAWMRQTAGSTQGIQGLLAGLYLGLSSRLSPGEPAVEAAMEPVLGQGGAVADAVRRLYAEQFAPLVKRSAVLSGNSRTIAAFLSMMLGSPVWFFIFEITVVTLAPLEEVTVYLKRKSAISEEKWGQEKVK